MKITKRQLRRLIKEAVLLEYSQTFDASKGRWTYEWTTSDDGISWTLSDDEGMEITGTEEKNNWPVLDGVPLDAALEAYEAENEDDFKFNDGREGTPMGDVAGTEAWAEIQFDSSYAQKEADKLWKTVNKVGDKIADWGDYK
jgi:hypothetical protein